MGTPRDLKVQMAAETRARERAQALAKLQAARADRAEAALAEALAERDEALAERDAWRSQALAAQTSDAQGSAIGESTPTEQARITGDHERQTGAGSRRGV